MRICFWTGVLLCCHSATCSKPGNAKTCMAALSPPVPRLGSNPTIYVCPLFGVLYQRTCPCLSFGSTPSKSGNFKLFISVSSHAINSHSCSRLNRSSPIFARSLIAHASSRSGCSLQCTWKLLNPFFPSTCSSPKSSIVFFAS